MTSLNAATLPSDDEEDDDYHPTMDNTAETANVQQSTGKRRRGVAHEPDATEGTEALQEEDLAEEEIIANPAKKAKFDQLWASLNQRKAAKQQSVADTTASAQVAAPAKKDAQLAAKPFSLAAICRPVATTRKADSDAVSLHSTHQMLCLQVPLLLQPVAEQDWKRQLGIKSRPNPKPEEQVRGNPAESISSACSGPLWLPLASACLPGLADLLVSQLHVG